MAAHPLKVAWISFFPIEWLPEVPAPLRNLPRVHPATWQRVLLEEFQSVADLELHVFAVRRHFPANYSFSRGNAVFHCLKLPRGMRTLSWFWWETLMLRRELQRIRPDLVHAWGTERGAALVASRLGLPYLVSMQGLLEWYSTQVSFNWLEKLEVQLEKQALRRAAVVTTESAFAVRWLGERYPHLQIHQAEHAPNWLFHRLQRQPRSGPVRFLFVGVMSPTKGTDLLLQALDRLKGEFDFRLRIIGMAAPEFLERLKASTSAELWERISMSYGLSPAQVAEEMSQATIMLFPTRADTSPNSVKEAVVAGLPVVASAVGGIVDYVLPGRNGFTFPAGSLDEFTSAIRAAVTHPLFSQGKVETETMIRMRDYLSPRTMAEKFLAAYQRVLKRAERC
ncbi:MAG TPA: glycosyltransferase family 4 protein [Clostridia bacterium]|nr:glycosyltransferase family 4 protein [Clostridia bacterium]